MYKIKFIPTGHVFILPENEAERLKKQNPNEYLILEKNGKKYSGLEKVVQVVRSITEVKAMGIYLEW